MATMQFGPAEVGGEVPGAAQVRNGADLGATIDVPATDRPVGRETDRGNVLQTVDLGANDDLAEPNSSDPTVTLDLPVAEEPSPTRAPGRETNKDVGMATAMFPRANQGREGTRSGEPRRTWRAAVRARRQSYQAGNPGGFESHSRSLGRQDSRGGRSGATIRSTPPPRWGPERG